MTNLTIQIENQSVLAELERLQRVAVNMQPAFNSIGQEIKGFIEQGFRDLRSPEGVNWAVLSPVTIAKRTNNSSEPLNDTGVLKNSFTVDASNSFVEIGTNAKQATMMNFGGTKAQFPHLWGNIPARPFMPIQQLPAQWEKDIVEIIKRHIEQHL